MSGAVGRFEAMSRRDVTQEVIDLLDAMNTEGRIFHADYSLLHDLVSMLEPLGEPSDAQVTAEALRKWPHDPNDANVAAARAVRRLSFLQGALWMRTTLRAAGEESQ